MKTITFRAMKQKDNKDAYKEWKEFHPEVKVVHTKSWNDENAAMPCFLEVMYEV